MLDEKLPIIRDRLIKTFSELGEANSGDLAFHLTDWLSDLEECYKTFSSIEQKSDEEIERFVYRFLAHVPNHLVAAKKLSGIGKTEDVFNVGIFEDDE
jgi:hypothetical protein